jgi:hypothetical protein
MPRELTNTQSIVTAGLDAQATQEDASNVQRWEPGLKPSRTMGYSLADGRRHTRSMVPAPATQRDGEALLATEPQRLMRLLAATEMALFERILELGDESALDEREDISRAFDVVLDLKATQASASISTDCGP